MNRLELLFKHQDKLLKTRLKKVNESIDPTRSDWDSFEEKIQKLMRLYDEIWNGLNQSDAFVDSKFYEFYCLLDGLKWSYDHHLNTNLIRAFEGADESLRETLTDDANDSGDFDQYDEDEYNAEATHENIIDNDEYPLIIEHYMNSRAKNDVIKKLMEAAAKSIKRYEEEETEPEFDGNFDEINVQQPEQKDQMEELALNKLKDIIKTCENVLQTQRGYKNAWNTIYVINEDIEQISDLEITETIDEIKDDILQWVDENYSNDWDFVSITEGERDSDATWERISEEGTADLIRNYADNNDVKNFMDEIDDEIRELFDEYKEYKNNGVVPSGDSSEEDEGDGSEYNE